MMFIYICCGGGDDTHTLILFYYNYYHYYHYYKGGPDGDVGGNLLKIMNRDFPDTCCVVGIADGGGVAEDPNGLDMNELMRLFNEVKSIAGKS